MRIQYNWGGFWIYATYVVCFIFLWFSSLYYNFRFQTRNNFIIQFRPMWKNPNPKTGSNTCYWRWRRASSSRPLTGPCPARYLGQPTKRNLQTSTLYVKEVQSIYRKEVYYVNFKRHLGHTSHLVLLHNSLYRVSKK